MEETKSLKTKTHTGGNVIPLEKGKLPPQAVELEEAVLGAMLIDKKGVDEVIDILQANAFIKPRINTFLNPFLNCLKLQNQLIYSPSPMI